MTNLLLTTIKILKHSHFLKDLVETAFIIMFASCPMTGYIYGPLDPSQPIFEAFPAQKLLKIVATKQLFCGYITRIKPWIQPSFSSVDVISKPMTARLCHASNFYSWNWKTLKSETNIVFLQASHTTKPQPWHNPPSCSVEGWISVFTVSCIIAHACSFKYTSEIWPAWRIEPILSSIVNSSNILRGILLLTSRLSVQSSRYKRVWQGPFISLCCLS